VLTRVNNSDVTAEYARQLSVIHAAPAWLWPALVAAMLPSTRPLEICRVADLPVGEVLVDPGLGQGRARLGSRMEPSSLGVAASGQSHRRLLMRDHLGQSRRSARLRFADTVRIIIGDFP
jgi:hypothetical protein